MTILFKLFYTFVKVGLFSFGGGYGMLSVIQGEIVTRHAWLTSMQFTDIVAVSQMTPGPIGINSATYVGYTAALNATGSPAVAVAGSLLASFAVMLPSFVIMLTISRFFMRYGKNPAVERVFACVGGPAADDQGEFWLPNRRYIAVCGECAALCGILCGCPALQIEPDIDSDTCRPLWRGVLWLLVVGCRLPVAINGY